MTTMNETLYYNAEMRKVAPLDDWKGPCEELKQNYEESDFAAWASEHLTDIDDLPDCYEMDDLTTPPISDVTGKYLIVELDSEDTPEFPYIPRAIWDGIEAYNDLFSEIQSGQELNLAAAIMQLKMLRGHPVPELSYTGHGFTGWDGRIIRIEEA